MVANRVASLQRILRMRNYFESQPDIGYAHLPIAYQQLMCKFRKNKEERIQLFRVLSAQDIRPGRVVYLIKGCDARISRLTGRMFLIPGRYSQLVWRHFAALMRRATATWSAPLSKTNSRKRRYEGGSVSTAKRARASSLAGFNLGKRDRVDSDSVSVSRKRART